MVTLLQSHWGCGSGICAAPTSTLTQTRQTMNKPLSETMAEHAAEMDKMVAKLEDVLSESKVVGEAPHRDTWLVRFLVGHKFNVDVAAEKFRAMVKMRVKNNVDDIRAKFENGMKPNDIPGFKEHFACCQGTFHLASGNAQDGSPINIQQVAIWDYEAYDKIPVDLGDQFELYQYEYMFHILDQLTLRSGKLVGFVKVLDLKEARWELRDRMSSMHSAHTARGERLGEVGQPAPLPDCYPEATCRIRIVNAPAVVAALWWIAKAFLPARTQEKIQIVGQSGVGEELLKVVPAEVLPRDYGGEYDGKYLM